MCGSMEDGLVGVRQGRFSEAGVSASTVVHYLESSTAVHSLEHGRAGCLANFDIKKASISASRD